MKRRVDSRGRISIGVENAGKVMYVVKIGDSYFVTPDEGKAEEVKRRGLEVVLSAYMRLLEELGEPSPEEVEEAVEEELWRGASSTRRS
ncbi:MAG: hypothetical protein TU35_009180 [Thermoproteus sp. AZ2]|uniref:Uncharacterized protein n=1 Tax=Thermoproteus sp. AZ2 TaxID=1609232 RepID=A0ACC6V2W3_9CREN